MCLNVTRACTAYFEGKKIRHSIQKQDTILYSIKKEVSKGLWSLFLLIKVVSLMICIVFNIGLGIGQSASLPNCSALDSSTSLLLFPLGIIFVHQYFYATSPSLLSNTILHSEFILSSSQTIIKPSLLSIYQKFMLKKNGKIHGIS